MNSAVLAIIAVVVLAVGVAAAAARRRRRTPATTGSRAPGIAARLAVLFGGGETLSTEDRAQLRGLLLAADFGTATAESLIDAMLKTASGATPADRLCAALAAAVSPYARSFTESLPRGGTVILVGVNGSGKTTACAKLAKALRDRGDAVVLGAADTFRAAAAEQLQVWGERLGVRVVRQREGADPAAVTFDTIQAAARIGATAVIDTAGRLHADENLLQELRKIVRVAAKAQAGTPPPPAVWLALDAGQGQSTIEQARKFREAVPVAGVVVNKLDGDGKAGFLVRVAREFALPIVAIGVGEGIDDLHPLDPDGYARWVIGD